MSSRDGTFPIHRLAAKAQIKQLQDSGKDKNKALIVLLSTATNVISCHTSMVGVDKDRKQKVVGHLMRRYVPDMTDEIYKMIQCLRSMAVDMGSELRAGPQQIDRICTKTRSASSASRGALRCAGLKMMDDQPYNASEKKNPSKEPNYMTLVALQTFSGQWMLSAELAAAMNTTLAALQSAAPIKTLDVWATVLALTYLEVKFGNKRDEWEMVEAKAKRWLDLQDREGLSIDDLLQKAKAVVEHRLRFLIATYFYIWN